jgi:RNA polymerase sigma-70 factor (ECF subfamily)
VRSDEELMIAYGRGDAAAFRELFSRYAPLLLRMLLRQLRVREEANDFLQQTFLQLHRARLDFDTNQRFRPWIFTIALNLKREHFRRVRRRPEAPLDDALAAELGVEGRGTQRWEARRDLIHGLSKLRPEQREVIELHWFEGLSFPEIGECLGVSTNAVKVRAHRGYVTLRERLGDVLPPLTEESSNRAGPAGIDPESVP